MAFDKDLAFEISDNGFIIEGGVHFIGGDAAPSHTPTGPTIYDRTNGERYFHAGVSGGWVLLTGSSSPSFNIDDVLTDNAFDALADNDGNLITGV